MGGSENSSSGEEDGDAEWMAAIDSVATAATFTKHTSSNGRVTHQDDDEEEEEQEETPKPQTLKLYQVKAQKILDDILEKSIQVTTIDSAHVLKKDPDHAVNDNGFRLFRCAPPGIVFDHLDQLRGPTKKPKILPGDELDEKSKKFRKQLQSVAVDGADIIAAAKAGHQKALAKVEAREASAKAAAKREEERIAELKKIRGERWLPSVARQMRINVQRKR